MPRLEAGLSVIARSRESILVIENGWWVDIPPARSVIGRKAIWANHARRHIQSTERPRQGRQAFI